MIWYDMIWDDMRWDEMKWDDTKWCNFDSWKFRSQPKYSDHMSCWGICFQLGKMTKTAGSSNVLHAQLVLWALSWCSWQNSMAPCEYPSGSNFVTLGEFCQLAKPAGSGSQRTSTCFKPPALFCVSAVVASSWRITSDLSQKVGCVKH